MSEIEVANSKDVALLPAVQEKFTVSKVRVPTNGRTLARGAPGSLDQPLKESRWKPILAFAFVVYVASVGLACAPGIKGCRLEPRYPGDSSSPVPLAVVPLRLVARMLRRWI